MLRRSNTSIVPEKQSEKPQRSDTPDIFSTRTPDLLSQQSVILDDEIDFDSGFSGSERIASPFERPKNPEIKIGSIHRRLSAAKNFENSKKFEEKNSNQSNATLNSKSVARMPSLSSIESTISTWIWNSLCI